MKSGRQVLTVLQVVDNLISRRVKIIRKLSTECWEYQGHIGTSGYGQIRWRQENRRVHRVIAHIVLNYNLYSDDRLVGHKCDNKICFNPIHLEFVSHGKNLTDAYERGLR